MTAEYKMRDMNRDLVQKKNKKKIRKNFMAPFYGWGSTASRVENHCEKEVYFLQPSSQKFRVKWKSEMIVSI